MNKFKLVVFDAYGTLFDVYSIGKVLEDIYPNQGAQIATIWRDKQIEYTRLISQADPCSSGGSQYYESFWEITRASLLYATKRLNLTLTEALSKRILDQYWHLEAFPENLSVLKELKASGAQLAILSNGSNEMLNAAVESAGMAGVFDEVISVSEIKQFKVVPKSYALVEKYFPIPKSEILFVSSNGWDVMGAAWYGFNTFWVNRQSLPFEEIGPRPSGMVKSLADLIPFFGK